MSRLLNTDAQWLEIFNTGKKNGEIRAEYGYSNDSISRARSRVVDQIEIAYIDKNPGTHGPSQIDCFHEELRNMLSWNWAFSSMVKFLKTQYGVNVSESCVLSYCRGRFEVAS